MFTYFSAGGALVILYWLSPGAAQYENCTGDADMAADGWCDAFNNNESCSYDGGDCCPCSCVDGLTYECGSNEYFCKDEGGCLDPAVMLQFPNCKGDMSYMADGTCTINNNSPECGYDGGDCCMCTCIDGSFCSFHFSCTDPDAGNELFSCEAPPPTVLPCSVDAKQTWIVEDTADARVLVEAVNCSGGLFQVEWKGNISMDETIYIFDGTILHISGLGVGAVMSGNHEKRLVTVVNASLYLTNINIEFGAALVGGAIAASASRLTLNHTSFFGNQADGFGGALYVVDGSTASLVGDTTSFLSNKAVGAGGAIFVDGGSVFSWKGRKTYFIDNLSEVDGGAVAIRAGSAASWDGEVLFSNNSCRRYGGAVYTSNSASVSWDGVVHLSNNTAGEWGGAFMIVANSHVSWKAEMTFVHNVAGYFAGGLYIGYDSTLLWSGVTQFAGNRAGISGGAIVLAGNSDAFGSGSMTFDRNSAEEVGGAVHVAYNSTITWFGETTFTSNTVKSGDAGALVIEQSSQAFWSEKATFSKNSAQYGGGKGGAVLVTSNSAASWMSDTFFTRNSAVSGGAITVENNSTISFGGNTTFDSNEASSGPGGALYGLSSNVYFGNTTSFIDNKSITFGGAVAFIAELSASDLGASLTLEGSTIFVNNTCEANGGALSLIGRVAVTMKATEITFLGNRAGIAGGAIYMWSTDVGPEFIGVSFVLNYAQHGGGVYSTGSGNGVYVLSGGYGSSPVVFESCIFVKNQASATGGAIQSAAGQDKIANTMFFGNRAAEGGALNLAGTALFVNCSFQENTSNEGGGPAVSNIGHISGISNSSFLSNAINCEWGMFLEYKSVR